MPTPFKTLWPGDAKHDNEIWDNIDSGNDLVPDGVHTEVFHIGVMNSSWWRHQMETFSASLAFCAGNSPITGEFPAQRPVTRSFGVFFDLRLNKRLSKQSRGWWFETQSRSLWRHCNVAYCFKYNFASRTVSLGITLSIIQFCLFVEMIWT